MPDGELRVAVLGAAGYVGGELLRLLGGHPAVGEVRAFSESAAGRPWGGVHPALAHLAGGVFEHPAPVDAGSWADVVFLAMPHGRSGSIMDGVLSGSPRLVVDTAADFRLAATAGGFVYGLADASPERLRSASRIAAPGCFATAALLALLPFARAGLLAGDVTVFAVTGSSGSGVEPRRTTHHPVRAHSFFAYALAGHRHQAEIDEELGRQNAAGVRCRLIPHSAPLVRGIHATVRIAPARQGAPAAELLRGAYEGRPFVRVTAEPPELAAVVGTNFVHLHASPDPEGGAVVTVAIDNLVKGAAGQAVQGMNLALGLDETAGLTFPGLFPC